MLRRKKNLHILELCPAEKRLLICAMLHFRNMLLATERPVEDVNEIPTSQKNCIMF